MPIQTLALNFEHDADALPEWLPLIPAGLLSGRDGRQWLNDQPEAVIALNRAKERDIVFDYEHATQLKASKGEPAPAAGWIAAESLQVREGAVWGQVQWNPAAQDALRNREYRYYSPAFLFDANNRVTDIHHIALTNRHNLFDLPALNNQQEEQPMALALFLATALGLPATASDDDALSAINTLKNNHQLALNAQQDAESKVPDPKKFVPVETHTLALNRASDAEGKLTQIQTDRLTKQAEALVDGAIVDNKFSPANRDHYLALCRQEGGIDTVKDLIAAAPKVIAPDTNLDGKKPGTDQLALNAEQLAIAAAFGNSAEDLAKYAQA